MSQGGWAERTWAVPPRPHRVLVIALILATGLVSYASVALREPGAIVATWWPAAGVAAIAVLAARGARPWAALGIAVAVIVVQLWSGREIDLIIGYGIANAVEAWVMVAALTWRRSDVRLDRLLDVGQLMVATLIAASTMALLGGFFALITVGAEFVPTALSLLASHGTALLVITPLALVPFRRIRGLGVVEAAAQAVSLVAIITVIFWPGNVLPVMYVALLAIMWGALRLPMFVIVVELVVMTLIATALTARGGGPFVPFAVDDPRLAITLMQAFISVYALLALLVAAARNDSAMLYSRLQERESLLRSGIVNSETGILIAEIDRQRLRIVGANPTAMLALGLTSPTSAVRRGELALDRPGPLFGVGELDDMVRARSSGQLELVRDDRRFDVAVTVYPSIVGTEVATMVFTDVTARDERERRALAAAETLRDLNRQKDDFISSVSHELRTPVTSILGFAEELELADLAEPERVASDVIARNARRLASVIEDVLELSRPSSGAMAMRPSAELDLVDVLQKALQDSEGLRPERRISLSYQGPTEPVPIGTSPTELGRVLANLLSNASKFSPRGATVAVRLEADESEVHISIHDDGPGIPAADLDHVWDRFYRVQSPDHRDVPGTGLGLPIVKALVEMRLAGQVTLESTPGSGTTAHVRLPRDRDAALAARRATDPDGAAGAPSPSL